MKAKQSFFERNEALILGGVAVALTMGVWQALWSAGKISPLFLSGPSAIAKQFVFGLQHGTLLSDMAYSGINFAAGFALALVAGVALGVLIGWYRRFRLVCDPFVNALYATPRIAMVPMIIIWFGVGMWSKVFIVFLSSFFPVLINTVGGIRSVDPDLLRAARAFIDPELQSGKLQPEDAYRILETDVVLSHAFAQEEVERFTYRNPGQANSYFYGYTKLLQLRKDTEAALGPKFNQLKFHDFILAQGLLPPDLMRQAVQQDFIPSQK